MQFDNLAEKCQYYRNLGEHRLMPNGHVIMMLDGRAFSKLIKNKFKKPFDKRFVNMMDETAKHLCENISGVVFAYVQSDEISLYIRDDSMSGPFFGMRQSKLLSVPAAMAAGMFNQLYMCGDIENRIQASDKGSVADAADILGIMKNHKLAEFDCKVWNVPNENEVFAWFLWRQIDCVRNSKQQTAQTWLPHKALMGKDTDEQIKLLKEERGVDWNEFSPNVKYGRIIRKIWREAAIPEKFVKPGGPTTTTRGFWTSLPMPPLTGPEGKDEILKLISDADKNLG